MWEGGWLTLCTKVGEKVIFYNFVIPSELARKEQKSRNRIDYISISSICSEPYAKLRKCGEEK